LRGWRVEISNILMYVRLHANRSSFIILIRFTTLVRDVVLVVLFNGKSRGSTFAPIRQTNRALSLSKNNLPFEAIITASLLFLVVHSEYKIITKDD